MIKKEIEKMIIQDNNHLLRLKNESKLFYNLKRLKLFIKNFITL